MTLVNLAKVLAFIFASWLAEGAKGFSYLAEEGTFRNVCCLFILFAVFYRLYYSIWNNNFGLDQILAKA